jgi:hypothetical protein
LKHQVNERQLDSTQFLSSGYRQLLPSVKLPGFEADDCASILFRSQYFIVLSRRGEQDEEHDVIKMLRSIVRVGRGVALISIKGGSVFEARGGDWQSWLLFKALLERGGTLP